MILKALQKKKKNKKAFTLIELIVVIAIIGVLVAILVPTMSGFVDQAQSTADLANARTIYSVSAAEAALMVSKKIVPTGASVKTAVTPQLTGIDGDFVVVVDETTSTVTSITFTPTGRAAVAYPN